MHAEVAPFARGTVPPLHDMPTLTGMDMGSNSGAFSAETKNSNSGTVLRLRGRGVPSKGGKGDHLVELQIVLPDNPDQELVGCITDWEAKHPYDPRKEMEARS